MTTRGDADDALRQAIADHAAAYDMVQDDDMLNEYAVVAHWQSMAADGDASRYTTHFTRSEVPAHLAIGLFRTGLNIVEERGE